MRPKMMVSATRSTTTPTLTANTAGRNCSFAIHPNHSCAVPVKSRNSQVSPKRKTEANATRIFFSIIVLLIL